MKDKNLMLEISPFRRIPEAKVSGKILQKWDSLKQDWSIFDTPTYLRKIDLKKKLPLFLQKQAE